MSCEGFIERIVDAADGAGPEPELARHLASCAGCAEALARAREARAALLALPELEVPAGAWE
jgi:anti-sigma factor RsiW